MTIKWDDVQDETIGILQEYLKIDTTNPPGNEKPAADYLKKILHDNGLETEEYAAAEDRPCLISRIPGKTQGNGIILLHHMDVVPVEREHWTVDPFSGLIKDGFIWGRGSLDMKSLGILELSAFCLAAREKLPLDRELIYIAVPDEETGGSMGADWLAKNHPDKVKAEYLLNEGGSGWKQGEMSGVNLGIGEKGPLWLKLKVDGPPGHGSIPLADNACVRLVKALDRITSHPQKIKVVDEMRVFLDKVGIERDISLDDLAAHDAMSQPQIAAMFHNTISLTGLTAGQKTNVIPSKAEATLDCRLLPGVTNDDFISDLRQIIDDDSVQIETIIHFPASSSTAETEMYQVLEAIMTEEFPGALILPTISTGFTDSRCFRDIGIHSYGLSPMMVDMNLLKTVHGHDERLPLEGIGKGVRIIFEMIKRLNSI